MSASNHTPNYSLPQFASTDKPSWLGDVNSFLLAIDTALKNILDVANGAVGDISGLETDINAVVVNVSALQVSLGNLQTALNATDSNVATANGNISALQTATASNTSSINALQASKAPLDSPEFVNNPKAPTKSVGDNTNALATTAFAKAQIANDAPLKSTVTGTLINAIWSGTQVQYDAIVSKDANTLYFIVG